MGQEFNYVCIYILYAGVQATYYTNILSIKILRNIVRMILTYIVTLFEVMVGANWWIVMEGVTTAENDENTRAYFLAFMIATTVN